MTWIDELNSFAINHAATLSVGRHDYMYITWPWNKWSYLYILMSITVGVKDACIQCITLTIHCSCFPLPSRLHPFGWGLPHVFHQCSDYEDWVEWMAVLERKKSGYETHQRCSLHNIHLQRRLSSGKLIEENGMDWERSHSFWTFVSQLNTTNYVKKGIIVWD